ncbi:MAG: hypothetical protein ABL914_08170, partial [Novosphingobium sp.]
AKAITAATATAAATERIEIIFAETVALVAATATTPSIKTHKVELTFVSPQSRLPGGADETHRATGQTAVKPSPLHLST